MAGKKEIRLEGPVHAGGLTLLPVSQVTVGYWRHGRRLAFYALKRPVGIVVVSPTGRKIFKMDGRQVSPEELKAEYPDVQGL